MKLPKILYFGAVFIAFVIQSNGNYWRRIITHDFKFTIFFGLEEVDSKNVKCKKMECKDGRGLSCPSGYDTKERMKGCLYKVGDTMYRSNEYYCCNYKWQ